MADKEMQFYEALRTIAKDYQSSSQLRKSAGKRYGLEYQDALEMAYDNIQLLAKSVILGYRPKKESGNG